MGRALLLLVLVWLCQFLPTIVSDQQLAYRDAGGYYWPTERFAQREWSEGRFPLWSPHIDCGAPFAANPVHAVFYPGKLVYRCFPFPLAFKLFHTGHVLLASVIMLYAARRLGLNEWPALIASLSYAYSGYVFFQLYNQPYLIGAAWLPLALACSWCLAGANTWKRASSSAELTSIRMSDLLGLVLSQAMIILAGDVQSAWFVAQLIPFMLIVRKLVPRWQLIAMASWLAFQCLWIQIPHPVFRAVLVIILLIGLFLLGRSRRTRFVPILAFAGAGILVALLSLVQLVATAELASQSMRTGPMVTREHLSFHPMRMLEWMVPNLCSFDGPWRGNWLPVTDAEQREYWVTDVSAGMLTMVFLGIALISITRARTLFTSFLATLMLISLLIALGKYLSFKSTTDYSLTRGLGVFWLIDQIMVGHTLFRYPAKWLLLTTFAISMLAGFGSWRLLHEQRFHKLARLSCWLLLVGTATALLLLLISDITLGSSAQLKHLLSMNYSTAVYCLAGTLIRMIVLMSVSLFIFRLQVHSRGTNAVDQTAAENENQHGLPKHAWLIIVVLAADLLLARGGMMFFTSTAELDREPVALRLIKQDNQNQLSRVHRIDWVARELSASHSHASVSATDQFRRDVVGGMYSLQHDVSLLRSDTAATITSHERLFIPGPMLLPAAVRAQDESLPSTIFYSARAIINAWNTRYFIVPRQTDFADITLGQFALRKKADGTPLRALTSPDLPNDLIILHNDEALTRTWTVPEVEVIPPIADPRSREFTQTMARLAYRERDGGLALWPNLMPGQSATDFPFRQLAVVEAPQGRPIYAALRADSISNNQPNGPNEQATITEYISNRVTVSIRCQRPGFLILADTFYPGWKASINHQPTMIYRANLLMRGVVVPAGEHTVTFYYQPDWLAPASYITVGTWFVFIIMLIISAVKSWRR